MSYIILAIFFLSVLLIMYDIVATDTSRKDERSELGIVRYERAYPASSIYKVWLSDGSSIRLRHVGYHDNDTYSFMKEDGEWLPDYSVIGKYLTKEIRKF